MRKTKKLILGLVFLTATLLQTGCIGSFKLTNNLYDWNKSLNGKGTQAVVFAAMVIVPVYGITLFVDGIILNSIEFWSGSNPMAMQAGDIEIETIEMQGNSYQITATQNQFHVEQLTGEQAGEFFNLIYNPVEKAWFLKAKGQSKKVVAIDSGNDLIRLFKPDGNFVDVDASTNPVAVRAAVNLEFDTINGE